MFVYLESYCYRGNLASAEWAGYLKKAKELNPECFNYWIDKDGFQNLRAAEIKK